MALKPKLEFGEKLLFRRGLSNEDYPYPFTFAITDRAVFVTREQHLRKESWVMERIPKEEIEKVSLRTEGRAKVFLTAAAIAVIGIFIVVLMLIPLLRNYSEAEFRVAPFLLVAFGAMIPFFVSRRRILVVKTRSGEYKWKPRVLANSWVAGLFFKAIRRGINLRKILSLQNDFVEACSRFGYPTEVDELAASHEFTEQSA